MIATPLCRGTCPLSGVTLRKEAGGGNPTTRRHGARGTLQSSSSPETPPSFGGTRFSAAAGGSHRIWRPGWGADWLAYPPQRPQPQDSPAWGPSLLRPQGRDASPGPQGPRGTESAALLSFFLSCYVYFEFEYIGDLHCCGLLFFFQCVKQRYSFIHRCIYALLGFFFSYRLFTVKVGFLVLYSGSLWIIL